MGCGASTPVDEDPLGSLRRKKSELEAKIAQATALNDQLKQTIEARNCELRYLAMANNAAQREVGLK